jgi:hypothetical protein
MKPLNLDNRPCSPVSSNCVVWQGPTLDCINLCTGDTISDVVAKMATELCTLLDQTNVTNYDLSCLGITACGPKDFQALIQLLIEKICELEGIPTDTTRVDSACPDCVVTVKPCFVQNNQTTMQLVDYVQMIAQKVCDLIDQIGDLQSQINNLDIRVTVLENTPPPENVIPSFTLTSCPIGSLPTGSTQFINTILQEFINNVWCPFYTATGTTSELINAVNAKCIDDTDLQLTTGTPFSFNPNWIQNASYNTVADAINNIWIALCDIYNFVSTLDPGDTLTIEEPCPCGEAITNNADIYVHIDVSSGPYAEAGACSATYLTNKQTLCTAVTDWYTNYQTANPSYTGNLYIFEVSTPETYLKFPRIIKNGNFTGISPAPTLFNWLNPSTATPVGATIPPNWNTPSWIAPTGLLYIAFVNEANNNSEISQSYHGNNSTPSLTVNQLQPTSGWTNDHAEFVLDYNNHWNFFRGVVYPANTFDVTSRNFLLQVYAATTNGPITSTGLSSALGPNFDATFSGLTYPITNLYVTANKGIWDYNWTPVLNKTTTGGGCVINFTAQEFEDDLNNILGTGSCDCVSLIDSWDPVTQTLALRSLTSCTLDISVGDTGCIAIEAPVVNNGLDYFYAQVTIGGPNNCNTAPATIPNVVNAPGKTVGKGGNNYPVGQRVQDVLQYNYMDSNGTVVNVTIPPYGGTNYIGATFPVTAPPTSTFLTVDNTTGIFEITQKGEYLLTMSTYLKANGDNTAYWKTTGSDGRFDIGICSGGTNSGDIFTGASKSIVANMDSNIILTAQCVVTLNVGSEVIFRMLNLTGEDYAGGAYNGSDAIRIGFVKLRNL